MTAPFTGQEAGGVNARVAIAYLKMVRKDKDYAHMKPAILIGVAVARLDGLAFPMLRLALLALNAHILNGGRSDAWLTAAVYGDLMRFSFRRCFYAAYKGNRR